MDSSSKLPMGPIFEDDVKIVPVLTDSETLVAEMDSL